MSSSPPSLWRQLSSSGCDQWVLTLRENNVAAELIPRIFTNEIIDEWDVVKAEKAKVAKEKDKRRAVVEAMISKLNSERSRLYSLFNSMSGFSRTQVSVSIDVIDNHISQFKAELASLS